MSSVASFRNVWKTYRRGPEEVHALRDVSLDIRAGEVVCVIGPSGSGKTTLLNLLGCIDVPTRGDVRVAAQDPVALPDREVAQLRQSFLGFVFQQFFLLPTLTAEENVLMPTLFSHRRADGRELLDRVGLGQRARHYPSQLSGGEMQRVAIARALVNSPRLLLADEPTGNLDSERAAEIFDLLRRIGGEGTAVVIVTHNEELARRAQRVVRLRDGCLAADPTGVIAASEAALAPRSRTE